MNRSASRQGNQRADVEGASADTPFKAGAHGLRECDTATFHARQCANAVLVVFGARIGWLQAAAGETAEGQPTLELLHQKEIKAPLETTIRDFCKGVAVTFVHRPEGWE